jgi:hypothetical protein
MLYSRSLARPVVAVIGDICHQLQMYVACRKMTAPIRPSS